MSNLDWEPDPWLYVATRTREDARRFFGAPPGWPVEFDRFDGRGPVWKVKAEGLNL